MPFDELSLKLENCYGIRSLDDVLECDANGTFAIYAANGTMKTSLSRTFRDLASGDFPSDEMYPDRITICEVLTESGTPLDADQIVVIPPYSESFERSARVSTLLVNPKLRDRYQTIEADLASKIDGFIKVMQVACGKRKGVDLEISSTFMGGNPNALLDALRRVKDEVIEAEDAPFSDIPYSELFNDKVEGLLAKKEIQELLVDYVTKLNSLLDESQFFSRDTFSYYGAEQVVAALAKHGFFEAKHAVELRPSEGEVDDGTRITSEDELSQMVQAEKDRIADDEELKHKYVKLGKQLEANDQVRKFKACLDRHPEIIPMLCNYQQLKQEVWKSYFIQNKDAFSDLVSTYERVRAERSEIQEQAQDERTHWEYVIDVFNQRFSVPFRLIAKNRVDLVLGQVDAMELGFEFQEVQAPPVPVERASLLKTLSQGERRAMYLLDVLFEVEARRHDNVPTFFVFDDVADSFDYKNKYAIIRYLEEIKEWEDARAIILTHNFDFLRSVHGNVVGRSRCKIAIKKSDGISLHSIEGINNIFVKDWKRHFHDDPLKRLASIPFMRNLVEYIDGDDNQAYALLTALMHWKTQTDQVRNSELDRVYDELFGSAAVWHDPDKSVWDLILEAADESLETQEGMNFPNKVVLAMASRLLADRHMIRLLGDDHGLDLTSNQSRKLFSEFRNVHGVNHESYDALHRTVLITPEHLHLNAFMYEPIIDVSINELQTLYADLKALEF